jgi:hypothetical protein
MRVAEVFDANVMGLFIDDNTSLGKAYLHLLILVERGRRVETSLRNE